MLCDNCGKKEANVKYSENINGVKKEMNLCGECSKKLGVMDRIDLRLPSLDFDNLFGSFLEDFNTLNLMPLFNGEKELKCNSCGSTFEDIINNGRYGCANCYDIFEERMDPILNKLQGTNRHRGRLGKISKNNIELEEDKTLETEDKENIKLRKMQDDLKQAIKEEKYEEAAKIRDKIKKIKKHK